LTLNSDTSGLKRLWSSFKHINLHTQKMSLVKFIDSLIFLLRMLFLVIDILKYAQMVAKKFKALFTRDILTHNIAIKRYFCAMDLYRPR